METATTETAPAEDQLSRTLRLAREIERVLLEMQADLSAAEAKLARNRERIVRVDEHAVTAS